MTLLTKRCKHCGTIYDYQASGHGCFDQPNNDRYCPSCWEKVLQLFETIPVRFESEWAPTQDYTVEELVKIEKEQMDSAKEAGLLPFKAFTLPLFDLSDHKNNNLTGVVHVNGKTYNYSYWTKKEKKEVSILVERNLVTGTIAPWIEADRG